MFWTSDSIAVATTNSIFLLLAIASVPLRFYAKRRAKAHVGIEDWLAVLTLFTTILLYISNIVAIVSGWRDARLVTDDPPPTIPVAYITSYISLWMFLLGVTFARLSFLHLYKRIFTGNKPPTAVMITLSLTYFCTVFWIVLMIRSCVFMRAEYHLLPREKRYIPIFIVFGAVVDLLFDIWLGILPIFYLSRLQMGKRKRQALYVVFGLGLICCIASGARLICTSIYLRGWLTGHYRASYHVLVGSYYLWPGIESCISTICISLPSYAVFILDNKRRSTKSSTPAVHAHTRTESKVSSRWSLPTNGKGRTPDEDLLDETADKSGGERDVEALS